MIDLFLAGRRALVGLCISLPEAPSLEPAVLLRHLGTDLEEMVVVEK